MGSNFECSFPGYFKEWLLVMATVGDSQELKSFVYMEEATGPDSTRGGDPVRSIATWFSSINFKTTEPVGYSELLIGHTVLLINNFKCTH